MPLYDLLTREERKQRVPASPWAPCLARWEQHGRSATSRQSLRHWLDYASGSIQEAVWDGLACPITPTGLRFWWTCPRCLFSTDVDGMWDLARCKPCERMRCAARTTANLTDAVCFLRRNGLKIRMLTLTMPSKTVLARDLCKVRLSSFIEGKRILKKAMKTVEWKAKVNGYLWSYEAPSRWVECLAPLMQSPNAPGMRALVPCTVNPHFHILVTGDYWPQSDLSDWAEKVGFGPVADVRLIRSTKGIRYSLKRVVTYASKESIFGTATRQTGGVVRQASQLVRHLWRNRTGKGPDVGFSQEDVAEILSTYQIPD